MSETCAQKGTTIFVRMFFVGKYSKMRFVGGGYKATRKHCEHCENYFDVSKINVDEYEGNDLKWI